MSERSILISGYYGFANAGDEAILAVILSKLRAHCPEARLVVISGNPPATAAAHSVDALKWSDPNAIADAVRAASLVIVGGGGLFHDYSGFIPDGLFIEGNWGLGFHATAALMAALFQKPLMIYAAGVGPLFSEHGRLFTRAAAQAASAISVRDRASGALLEELGISEVRVSADPAFALEPAPAERVREILTTEGRDPDARRLIVVVRHWDFGVHPVFWQEQTAAGLDRILDAREALGIDEVLFVPFQKLGGQSEDDVAVSRRIHAAMRYSHTGEARILEADCTPAELCGLLQSARLVVGMRLHALIFATSAGVPVVGLGYDPKIAEVMAGLDLAGQVIDLGALTAETLVQYTSAALARRQDLRAALERLRESTELDARDAADLFHNQRSPQPLTADQIQLLQTAVRSQLKAYDRLKRSTTERITELTHQTGEDAARIRELTERLQAAEQLAAEHANRLAQNASQIEQHKARLAELAAAVAHNEAERDRILHQVLQLEQNHYNQLSAATARAQASERALHDYKASLRRWLQGLRNQRAWRVMLVVRKAYSLALREGWKGRLHLIAWLPGLLIGHAGNLAPYEPHWEDED